MKKQGRGQFVNLSSIGGHNVYPTSAVYSATKFAVMGTGYRCIRLACLCLRLTGSFNLVTQEPRMDGGHHVDAHPRCSGFERGRAAA
jgi:short chain dehydrogenase